MRVNTKCYSIFFFFWLLGFYRCQKSRTLDRDFIQEAARKLRQDQTKLPRLPGSLPLSPYPRPASSTSSFPSPKKKHKASSDLHQATPHLQSTPPQANLSTHFYQKIPSSSSKQACLAPAAAPAAAPPRAQPSLLLLARRRSSSSSVPPAPPLPGLPPRSRRRLRQARAPVFSGRWLRLLLAWLLGRLLVRFLSIYLVENAVASRERKIFADRSFFPFSAGHAIGGMFGGGSSAAAPEQQADSALQAQASNEYQSNPYTQSCDVSAKALTKCLDENKGEYQMSICGWYLDQLVRKFSRVFCLKMCLLILRAEGLPGGCEAVLGSEYSER